MRGRLFVKLFGSVSFRYGDHIIICESGRAVRQLGALLLLHPDMPQRRERLIDLLWPESPVDRGRVLLSQALWQLRRLLHADSRVPEGAAAPEVDNVGDFVVFRPHEACEVDAAVFEHRLRRALSDPDASDRAMCERLADALLSYTGPLLDGDEEDWVLAERERFHSLWLHGSCELMRAQARLHRYEAAAATAREILVADALREGVHHDLMLLLALVGRRGEALRQYERCRSVFAAELGIEPLSTTRALAEMIRGGAIAERGAELADSTFSRQL